MPERRSRYQLTIRVERDGDELVRTYILPSFGVVGEHRITLDAIGREYRVGDQHGLVALSGVLARGDLAELEQHLRGAALDRAGAALFTALFGDEQTYSPVLRRAFERPDDAPRPDPIREALRVRICTQDPMLQGLPLRATMYNGLLLVDHGWTFEVSRDERPTERREFMAPGSVLIVAPDYEGMPFLGTDAHTRALSRLFESMAPGITSSPRFHVVQSFREVEEALAGMSPDILYYYGHAEGAEDELSLLLGEGTRERVLMRDFARQIKKFPPSVVILNGCGTGQAGFQSAGAQLLPAVPLVVANATTAYSRAASDFALQWLRGWLEEARDPVEALHDLGGRTSTFGFEWLTPIVHANYAAFTTREPAAGAALPYLPPEWLDREEQRLRAFGHVSDLARDAKRKVLALVGIGEPGNRVELLSRQIIDRIEADAGERLRVLPIRLSFPAERAPNFPEDLAEKLLGERILGKLRAELRTDGPIVHALRARAPRRLSGGMPIVWLDWGVFSGESGRSRDRQPYLDSGSLLAWMRFVRDQIAPDIPEDMRVVVMLTLEMGPEKVGAAGEALKTWESDADLGLRTPWFRFRMVSPLSSVKQDEILDYLEHTDCPIATDLAALLFQKTAGNYEQVLEYLRRGAPTWYPLRDELAGEGSVQKKKKIF